MSGESVSDSKNTTPAVPRDLVEAYTSVEHTQRIWGNSVRELDALFGRVALRDPATHAPLAQPLASILERFAEPLDPNTTPGIANGMGSWSEVGRLMGYMAPAIDHVLLNPNQKLRREHAMLRPGQVRELDRQCISWLAKLPGRTPREKLAGRERMKAVRRVYTHDLQENRLLRRLCELLEGLTTSPDLDAHPLGRRHALRLLRVRRSQLADVRAEVPTRPNNMLISHQHYSKFWRGWGLWRRLNEGLEARWAYERVQHHSAQGLFWMIASTLWREAEVVFQERPVRVLLAEDSEAPGIYELHASSWRLLRSLSFWIWCGKKGRGKKGRVITLTLQDDTRLTITQHKAHDGQRIRSMNLSPEPLTPELGDLGTRGSACLVHQGEDADPLELDSTGLLDWAATWFDTHHRAWALTRRAAPTRYRPPTGTCGLAFDLRGVSGVDDSSAGVPWRRPFAQLASYTIPDRGSLWMGVSMPHAHASQTLHTHPLLSEKALPVSALDEVLPSSGALAREDTWFAVPDVERTHVLRHHGAIARRFGSRARAVPRSVAAAVAWSDRSRSEDVEDMLVMVMDTSGPRLTITPLYRRIEDDQTFWERRPSLAPTEEDEFVTSAYFTRAYLSALLDARGLAPELVTRLMHTNGFAELVDHGSLLIPSSEDSWEVVRHDPELLQRVLETWLDRLSGRLIEWRERLVWRRLQEQAKDKARVLVIGMPICFAERRGSSRMSGRVKTTVPKGDRWFGFITVEGQESDVYFDARSISHQPKKGTTVTFDLTAQSSSKPRAVDVRVEHPSALYRKRVFLEAPDGWVPQGAQLVARERQAGQDVWREWVPDITLEVVRDGRYHYERLHRGGIAQAGAATTMKLPTRCVVPSRERRVQAFFWTGEADALQPLEYSATLTSSLLPFETARRMEEGSGLTYRHGFDDSPLSLEINTSRGPLDVSIKDATAPLPIDPTMLPRLVGPRGWEDRGLQERLERIRDVIAPRVHMAAHAPETAAWLLDGSLDGLFGLVWDEGRRLPDNAPYTTFLPRLFDDLGDLLHGLQGDDHELHREELLLVLSCAGTSMPWANERISAWLSRVNDDTFFTSTSRSSEYGMEAWRVRLRTLGGFLVSTSAAGVEHWRRPLFECLLERLRCSVDPSSFDPSMTNEVCRVFGAVLARAPALATHVIRHDTAPKLLVELTGRSFRNILSRLPEHGSGDDPPIRLLSPIENLARLWVHLLDEPETFQHELLGAGRPAMVELGRYVRRLDTLLADKGLELRRPKPLTHDRVPAPPRPYARMNPTLSHLERRMIGPSGTLQMI